MPESEHRNSLHVDRKPAAHHNSSQIFKDPRFRETPPLRGFLVLQAPTPSGLPE
jgi:hypothetical protein